MCTELGLLLGLQQRKMSYATLTKSTVRNRHIDKQIRCNVKSMVMDILPGFRAGDHCTEGARKCAPEAAEPELGTGG